MSVKAVGQEDQEQPGGQGRIKRSTDGTKGRISGKTGRRGKTDAAGKQDRDLFDMSDDDEEYMPSAKDQKDPEAFLGKRGLVLPRERRTKFDAKAFFQEMREQEASKMAIRAEIRTQEAQMEDDCRTQHANKVLEQLNSIVVKGNDGLVHFAGKLYKINEEGELVEDHGMKTQAQAFEQLNQLAQKYALEQQKTQNGQSSQATIDEADYRQILSEKKQNLKVLVGLLGHRHRNVSALFKSRVDWKRYTSVNQIEKQLEQNRKDGFIEKQIFLAETQNRQKKVQQQTS